MGQARSGNTQSQGLVLPRSLYSSRFMLLDPFRIASLPKDKSKENLKFLERESFGGNVSIACREARGANLLLDFFLKEGTSSTNGRGRMARIEECWMAQLVIYCLRGRHAWLVKGFLWIEARQHNG